MPDSTPESSKLPMFYSAPRPIDRVKDAGKRIRRNGFGFARNTNAIPVLIEEIPMAAAYYPIVFAAGPAPVPAAVVGLESDKNLFVNEDGHWVDGCYIPSYVRRYPFILMDDSDNKQFVLCIDEVSDFLNEEDGEALFDEGEPSKFLTGAMEFCASLRQSGDATDAFVHELQQRDLLQQIDAELPFSSGATVKLGGMLSISPQKFDALPDTVIVDWRRRGWLALVYAQLLSSHRWQSLAQLYGEAKGARPLAPSTSQAQPRPAPPPIRLGDEVEAAANAGFRLLKRPGSGKDF